MTHRRGIGLAALLSFVILAELVMPASATAGTQMVDFDCADFASQQEAQDVLEEDRSDPNRLDPDGDGQACEGLVVSAESTISTTLIGDLTSALAALLVFLWQRAQTRHALEEGESVEQRVERLTTTLSETSRVIGEIETEIRSRRAIADQLRHDAETA
jgi:hypothetical protein